MERFIDRYAAGKVLAQKLEDYKNRQDVLVLALPRGGVPVAYEIAKALQVPLDILVVRKLGVPGHEELAMGAIAMGNIFVFNQELIHELRISEAAVDKIMQAEQQELARREKKYRGNKPFPVIKNKTIILVDDGIATGATMQAAIQALRQQKPIKIIVAVPVAASDTYKKISRLADKIICPLIPPYFSAVGEWYVNFGQTEDDEVHALLAQIS